MRHLGQTCIGISIDEVNTKVLFFHDVIVGTKRGDAFCFVRTNR